MLQRRKQMMKTILRDGRASFMTYTGIEKATAMAKECMKSDYKKCGY